MKACNKCQERKPLEAFYKDPRNRDGRQGICRKCANAREKERLANDPDLHQRRLDYKRRHYHETAKAKKFESGDRWVYTYTTQCKRVGVSPVIEHFSPQDVIENFGDKCYYCETGEFENLDHYIPIKAGGPHTLENVRPSCFACNRAKSNTDPLEFAASIKAVADPDEANAASALLPV